MGRDVLDLGSWVILRMASADTLPFTKKPRSARGERSQRTGFDQEAAA